MKSKKIAVTALLSGLYFVTGLLPLAPLLLTAALSLSLDFSTILFSAIVGEILTSLVGARSIVVSGLLAGIGSIQHAVTLLILRRRDLEQLAIAALTLGLTPTYILLLSTSSFLLGVSPLEIYGLTGLKLKVPREVLVVGLILGCFIVSAVTAVIQYIVYKLVANRIASAAERFLAG